MKIRHLADYQDAARDLVNPNGHYQFYERIEGNGSGQHYDINGDMIADTADGEWQCYDDHPIADFRMYVHPRLSDGRRSSNDYHCYTSGVPVTDYVAAFWAGSGEYYTPDNDIRWKIVRGGWELKVLQEAGTALDWPVLLRGHPFEWEQGEAVTVERRASGLFTAAQVTLSPAGVVFDGTDNCCPECGRLLGTGHKLDCGQRASHNEPNAEEAGQ